MTSAIDDFSKLVADFNSTDLRKIRSKITFFYYKNTYPKSAINNFRNNLLAFTLLSKNNLIAHLASIETQFSLPTHLKEVYQSEVLRWDLFEKQILKLQHENAIKSKKPVKFLRAVCERMLEFLSETEHEYTQLLELLDDWQKEQDESKSVA
jgi:hypothetical protein